MPRKAPGKGSSRPRDGGGQRGSGRRGGAGIVRRGIGRPAAGPRAVGREALINRTCELLMQLPPNRITRAEVARRMGVDPSLIRYYFRDRSMLLLAAVEKLTDQFARIREAEQRRADPGPEGALCARVSALLKFEITYPFFHRLLLDELMHLNAPAASRFLQQLSANAIAGYGSILESGHKQGLFRRTDSALLFLAVIGMCEFFVNGMPIVRLALGKAFDERDLSARYRDFICDLLLHGLKGRAASPAAT
jgi:AcrR family transcriptional regulator